MPLPFTTNISMNTSRYVNQNNHNQILHPHTAQSSCITSPHNRGSAASDHIHNFSIINFLDCARLEAL